jgi:hypothetical protein
MNRNQFIRQSLGFSAALVLGPQLFTSAQSIPSADLLKRLISGNDAFVEGFLKLGEAGPKQGGRAYGYNFAKLSAAYSNPQSKYYKNAQIIQALEQIAVNFNAILAPDGTMNAGNIESPPDTAFVMEPLCSGIHILNQNKDKALDKAKALIKVPVERVGQALTVGGVHTPNHRWEISSALAWIYTVYPQKKYVDRIDEWLSEGIFIDEDGHYPERSMNYADVENRAFVTIGHLLNRPALFEPPTKSLEMAWYYTDPNGELITFDSRRQDQYSSRELMVQYLHYRYLAIKTGNTLFSAVCGFLETLPDFEKMIVAQTLYNFMATPLLVQELPKAAPLPTNYEKLFKTSSLARIRRGDTSMTIFGGNDFPLIIASGRSVSPNFFGYRKGKAALNYVRMSSRFFSMGFFRGNGLTKEGQRYKLHEIKKAPYYQPLKAEDKRKDGDYELTPSVDDRFWSKMSFDKRKPDFKVQESTVWVTENNGEVTLEIEVKGPEGVAVTLDLCFEASGTLAKVENKGGQVNFLPEGYGEFSVGGDTITFGPGVKKHEWTRGLEGEKYSVFNGNLNTPGHHVYLTGITPFKHTLYLK